MGAIARARRQQDRLHSAEEVSHYSIPASDAGPSSQSSPPSRQAEYHFGEVAVTAASAERERAEEEKYSVRAPQPALQRMRGPERAGVAPFPMASPAAEGATLTVGPTDSPEEQEASEIADKITSFDTAVPRSSERRIRRNQRASPSAASPAGNVPHLVNEVLASGGSPLESPARDFMERRFGHDFSRVRVHTGDRASRFADSVAARAYTVGNDIVFGSGLYSPETRDGRRLLAHELVHTIQQSEAVSLIQRDTQPNVCTSPPPMCMMPPPTPGVDTAPPGTIPPAAQKTVNYNGVILYTDPAPARKMLEQMIVTDGYKAMMSWVDALSTLPTRDQEFNTAFTPDQAPTANACISNTVDQRTQLEKEIHGSGDGSGVIDKFEAQAKARTLDILKQSETRINAERERYGIPAPIQLNDETPATVLNPTMADNEDTKGLATAAGDLVPLRKKVEELLKSAAACMQSNVSNNEVPGMPAKSVIPGKEEEYQSLQDQITEARHKRDDARGGKESLYPILAAYGPEGEDNTSSLENISRGTASQGWKFWKKNAIDELVPMIVDKLNNIQTVRAALNAGQVKIWDNPTIVAGTKADLGYAPGTWQNKIIDEKVQEVHDEEFLVNMLVAALAIGLGLVAIFATAGTATAAVATVGSAALSTGQAVNTLDNYVLAKAEEGTDFDKSKAISQEDPSLFWLALDLIAAAMDIKAATSAFKVLGPAVREAQVAGKTPDALSKLGEALDKYPPAVRQKVMAHIGSAVDTAKPALDELEKTARAQYKALADAGRLGEIDNIGEELFVQQMLSGARSQVIIAGEKGIARTGLMNELMQPGNARIAAIMKGDAEATKKLVLEHGNWKQLMGMLGDGTPEMRQAAKELTSWRNGILADIEGRFPAKRVPGSTEGVSDIDISTYGEDAGQKLIDAEDFMKKQFGEGWSEALRMNFYTDAKRLTLYEEIMPGLSKADQAALLGQLSGEAEKVNLAKMLAHAESNPARIAEVEAYAKKIGVDLNDPAIKNLAERIGGSAEAVNKERDKLLLEIDDLMKKYNAAADGSPEKIELAKTITSKQMEANAFTTEAYIGPGAGRMTVGGIKVVGQEAYQAALSNLEMIQHIMSEAGDVVTASREYEISKYINRFAEAAENAGAKTQGLDYWKNFSGFASKTERQATSEAVHLGERPKATFSDKGQPILDPDNPTIGQVTDQFLENQYEAWNTFSQQALEDMKKIAQSDPSAWTAPRLGGSVPTPKPTH